MQHRIIFWVLLFSLFSYGSSDSYQRGGMSELSFKDYDNTVLVFSAVKGKKLPSISSNFSAEVAFTQSADLSFDVLEIGVYGVYTFPLIENSLLLASRIGTSYTKIDMQNIFFMDKNIENIEGMFVNYGLSLHYSIDEGLGFYVEVKENKFSRTFMFGSEIGF